MYFDEFDDLADIEKEYVSSFDSFDRRPLSMEYHTEGQFMARFRLTKCVAHFVLENVKNSLEHKTNRGNVKIVVIVKTRFSRIDNGDNRKPRGFWTMD